MGKTAARFSKKLVPQGLGRENMWQKLRRDGFGERSKEDGIEGRGARKLGGGIASSFWHFSGRRPRWAAPWAPHSSTVSPLCWRLEWMQKAIRVLPFCTKKYHNSEYIIMTWQYYPFESTSIFQAS